MPTGSRFRQRSRAALAVAALLSAAVVAGPSAAPAAPAAAANPWDEPRFRGYTGEGWDEDHGVRRGRCQVDDVARAVALDARVPRMAGDLLQGAEAARIGPAIEAADRACAGLVIELLERGRAAHWQNPRTSIAYTVRPVGDLDANCREIEFTASQRGRRSKNRVRACRDADARWTAVVAAGGR